MISYMDEILYPSLFDDDEDVIDGQRIMIKSLAKVLPKIIENELTEKQRECVRLHYIQRKSQTEIARQLHLSQPTVCRHLHTSKDIINKILSYCMFSVKKANSYWEKIEDGYIIS